MSTELQLKEGKDQERQDNSKCTLLTTAYPYPTSTEHIQLFFRQKLVYDNLVYSSVTMTDLTKCSRFNSMHITCSINYSTVLWNKEEKQQQLVVHAHSCMETSKHYEITSHCILRPQQGVTMLIYQSSTSRNMQSSTTISYQYEITKSLQKKLKVSNIATVLCSSPKPRLFKQQRLTRDHWPLQ